MQEAVDQFVEDGYAVIARPLIVEDVAALNGAIDRDLRDHGDLWMGRGEQGRMQSADIALRSIAFDSVVQHPHFLPLVRELMDDRCCIEEVSAMIREPFTGTAEPPSWHRDFAAAPENPLQMRMLSVVIYLSDVTACDHSFSLVPGTHSRLVEQAADAHAPEDEVDILGPAGTVLLFHTSCVHAGRLRSGSRQRRTIHMYYGFHDRPVCSGHSHIPARLTFLPQPGLPTAFYCRADKT
jgi:ectoine hydroxylase-related dioxygenase (phytanoyl-CoA dioxygenase family)